MAMRPQHKWVLFTLVCLAMCGLTSSASHRDGARRDGSGSGEATVVKLASGRRAQVQSANLLPESTVQSLNKTSQAKVARSHLFVQLGQPRAASTFQFTMVCSIMRIRAYNDGKGAPVVCDFVSHLWLLDRDKYHSLAKGPQDQQNKITAALEAGGYVVVKTHNRVSEIPQYVRDEAPFFIAQKGGEYTDFAAQEGLQHVYTQEYDDFVHRGVGVLDDYEQLFKLDKPTVMMLHQFMRWWAVLRQCCGSQQSVDHRLQLHNSTLEHKHHPTDYDYPACQVYDLPETEKELLASELAKIAPESLCSDQGCIDGDWCSSWSEKIAGGLDFNGQPFNPTNLARQEHLQRQEHLHGDGHSATRPLALTPDR